MSNGTILKDVVQVFLPWHTEESRDMGVFHQSAFPFFQAHNILEQLWYRGGLGLRQSQSDPTWTLRV